jgi:crotonobetainyl-CoA:carnitine CoA-transferase CaiB-like acyl-CoA transferase
LRLLSPHNKPIRTEDGWISFTVNTDPQVQAFLKVTDRHHLLDDPRFSSVAARARHVAEWFEIRGAPLTNRTTSEWLVRLRAADIAAQPCNTLDTLPRDPHLQAVGLVQFEDHPTEGRAAAIRSTISFDQTYPVLRESSRPRGWDTRPVLASVGFTDNEIEELLATGAASVSQGR